MSTPTESKHPIQVVARRTGLSADVIRVWERRYGAVRPTRSNSRRRLYTDEDVSRLILLRKAILAGRRIGDVANLPEETLSSMVETDASAAAQVAVAPKVVQEDDSRGHLEDCIAAVEALNAQELDRLLTRARLELSTPDLMHRVLRPLLREVGDRWRSGTMRAYHEHLATSMVKSLLENLRPISAQPQAGPDIVITTPAGQLHELGALMVSVVAATEGWRVTYLGPNLPAEEIAAAARQRSAKAVALSLIYPPDDPHVIDELRRLRQLLPPEVAVVVGGRSSGFYANVLEEIGATRLEDLEKLRAELARVRQPYD